MRVQRPRSRVFTGFHRIGVAGGAPFIVAGLLVGGAEIWESAFPPNVKVDLHSPTAGFEILDEPSPIGPNGQNNNKSNLTQGADVTPKTKNYFDQFDEAIASTKSHRTLDLTLAGILLAIGTTVYAVFRSFGWIIDGFTGSDR